MKTVKLAALACVLPFCFGSAAQAAVPALGEVLQDKNVHVRRSAAEPNG